MPDRGRAPKQRRILGFSRRKSTVYVLWRPQRGEEYAKQKVLLDRKRKDDAPVVKRNVVHSECLARRVLVIKTGDRACHEQVKPTAGKTESHAHAICSLSFILTTADVGRVFPRCSISCAYDRVICMFRPTVCLFYSYC